MDTDTDHNAFFLAFSGDQITGMAQAVVESGYLEKGCTLDELKQVFRDRKLGADNVMNFLRYAESLALAYQSWQH